MLAREIRGDDFSPEKFQFGVRIIVLDFLEKGQFELEGDLLDLEKEHNYDHGKTLTELGLVDNKTNQQIHEKHKTEEGQEELVNGVFELIFGLELFLEVLLDHENEHDDDREQMGELDLRENDQQETQEDHAEVDSMIEFVQFEFQIVQIIRENLDFLISFVNSDIE